MWIYGMKSRLGCSILKGLFSRLISMKLVRWRVLESPLPNVRITNLLTGPGLERRLGGPNWNRFVCLLVENIGGLNLGLLGWYHRSCTFLCILLLANSPDWWLWASVKPLKRQENLHLKMSSVYVVCWIILQTFQTYFCIQANSVDPDQTAPRGAVSLIWVHTVCKNDF